MPEQTSMSVTIPSVRNIFINETSHFLERWSQGELRLIYYHKAGGSPGSPHSKSQSGGIIPPDGGWANGSRSIFCMFCMSVRQGSTREYAKSCIPPPTRVFGL